MKKVISLLVALIIVLSVPFSCMAAVDFVQSITYKPAPDIIIFGEEDGDELIGYIRDEEGNIVSTEHDNCVHKDCIIITPVSEAETTTEIPRETADSLLEEYNKLIDPSTKLSDVCDGLDEKIKEETKNKYGADDMVIRDMFNITEVCDNIKLHLPKDGYTFETSFNLGIGKDDYITAMVFNNGKWTPIKGIVNNGDGTVTCFFDCLGHVAFLVPGDAPSNVPTTGDTAVQNNILLWVIIMATSTCALIVLGVINHRSKKAKAK